MVGRCRSAGGRVGRIHESEVGAGGLYGHEEGFGGSVRVRRNIPGPCIVDSKCLVAGIAEEAEAEAAVPDHAIVLGIEVEGQENRVPGVEAEAVPILFRRCGRIAGAAHPAVGRQRVGGGGSIVVLDLGGRGTALHAQVQLIRPLRGSAGREVVDLEEVGAVGRDGGSGDRGREAGKRAVVVVELDNGGAVGGQQGELAVGAAASRERGHRRRIDAIPGIGAKTVEIDIADGGKDCRAPPSWCRRAG